MVVVLGVSPGMTTYLAASSLSGPTTEYGVGRVQCKTPSHFLSIEAHLQKRCKDTDVSYIQQKPTDSVDETIARKHALNRKIKTAAQKRRREDMSDMDQAKASENI